MKKLGLRNVITEVVKVEQAYTSLHPEICLGPKSISLHESAPCHLYVFTTFYYKSPTLENLLEITNEATLLSWEAFRVCLCIYSSQTLFSSNLDLWATAFT